MKIGYARVSTSDQTLTPQTDALNDAGCEKMFTDSREIIKAFIHFKFLYLEIFMKWSGDAGIKH
jgi:hypothetical protein